MPFANTVQLTASALAQLDDVGLDGTLVFHSLPAALEDVSSGAILIAGVSEKTPSGLLRVVTSVDNPSAADDPWTFHTLNAPIQLAFQKLHVRVARSAAISQSAATHQQNSGLLVQPLDGPGGSVTKTETFDYPLFDGDGDDSTRDDRIDLSGAIGGTLDYQFSMDFNWDVFGKLPQTVSDCVDKLIMADFDCSLDSLIPEAKVSFVTDTTLMADVKLEGAAIVNFKRSFPILPAQTLAEIPLGFLVLAPVVEIEGEIEGGASGSFETSLHAAATLEHGVDLSSKNLGNPSYHGPTLKDEDFDVEKPTVTLQAMAKASVSAKLNLLLYNVVGPYASASVYSSVQADPFADPCYSVSAGLEANLGITVEPTLPVLGSVTLFDWEAPTFKPFDAPIAQGSCSRPPMASQLAPGSGPDADHYAQPAFAPWSVEITAPVDGTLAVSPTDDTGFSDVERTIDGRYAIAGSVHSTLIKLDEAGKLTWARSYTTAADAKPLLVLGTAGTLDAGLLALARDPDSAEVFLVKLDQAGQPQHALALQLTAAGGCTPTPRALVRDASDGAWLAGSCVERQGVWFAHATQADDVEDVIMLQTPDNASISVGALTTSDGEPVLSGQVFVQGSGDRMFVARFGSDGEMQYAKRYEGCDQSPDLAPSAALAGDNGEVTFVGGGGGRHNGFLARIKRDGSVGFASFPGLSFGVGDVLALNAVAELPTSGYVAAGSTVELLGDGNTTTPGIALLGLDAVGSVRWAERYTLNRASGSAVASGFPGLRLTDDGGAFVAGLAADGGEDSTPGSVWAFKAFAKDGAISFDSGATRSDLSASTLSCSLTMDSLDLTASHRQVSARSLTLQVSSLPLTAAGVN